MIYCFIDSVYRLTITPKKEERMFLKVDFASSTPLYAQLKEQVLYSIASGKIKSGSKLPSVREVSTELRINPSTVTQAYRELEYEKIIFTKKGQGTFVSENSVQMSSKEKEQILNQVIEKVIIKAHHLGTNSNDLLKLFKAQLKKMKDFLENGKKEVNDE